ncbi:hypothetical protein RFD78_000810 [Klebsiella aerogenes]|nr:hypothetical protein [Klebsiella aerogenes]ELA0226288.1 hypothetical protein [Klebsiella aerogenes]
MTDITELAQMKGQKVEGSYYLAECTDCGKMYPSNKLNGGEPLFSGDYGECYCPHCNADDAAIGDCGDTAEKAWNYQQDRIDALVEALEKAQQVDEELCRLLPPGAEYMDPPDGGDVTPLEGVRRMVADYRQRIAELREWNAGLAQESFERQQRISELLEGRVGNALLERENHHVEVVGKLTEHINQLESRTVNLPSTRLWAGVTECYEKADVIAAIRAAGMEVSDD